VYGLLGSSATVGARHLSHYISFGVNLALLAGLCTYLFVCARERDSATESKHGPFLLCCTALVFVMADPTRHVLQHMNIWKPPVSSNTLLIAITHSEREWCENRRLTLRLASLCHLLRLQSSSQYREDCEAGIESFVCLSVVGWLFTVIFTYLGFALLFTSTFWNARLLTKLSDIGVKWREIRRGAASGPSGHADARDSFPHAAASINGHGPDLVVAVNSLDDAQADEHEDFVIDEGDEAVASPMVPEPRTYAHISAVGMDKL
jgi:hypothetical protein